MKIVYVSLVVLVLVVIEINSERIRRGACKGCQHEAYTRTKRAKYHTSPFYKFYNRLPITYPMKGGFSAFPPHGYLMDDSRLPQNLRLKVSRPSFDGHEDVNKFVTKYDFDKIMEFANEKDREFFKYDIESLNENPYTTSAGIKYQDKVIYNDNALEFDNDNTFSLNGPFLSTHEDFKPYKVQYINPSEIKETNPFTFTDIQPLESVINKNRIPLNKELDYDTVIKNEQFSNVNIFAHTEANEDGKYSNIFSDSSIMQEERLPKPSNLREDDFEVSYTNNVPAVVKADSNSYKIENLGTLPLMDYNSKLDTVDSYRVPHYTITSPEKYRTPASKAKIPVEPAPPASAVQDQSDAHLKATKIWTHKSKGTAYTLHDDGTLSLEKPYRPKAHHP